MNGKLLTTIFLALYSVFVLLYLLSEFFDTDGSHRFFSKIGDPFLEQHWSMFAPNPPASDRKILIQLYDGDRKRLDSTWIELTSTIRDNNKYNLFGNSQRMLKFLHGTTAPVLGAHQASLLQSAPAGQHTPGFQHLSAFKALHAYIRMAISKSDHGLTGCNYYKLRILDIPVAPMEHSNAQRTTYLLLESDLIQL